MMHTLVGWHVEMEFKEEGDRTRAAAMVRLTDGTEFRAHGTANRHPSDPDQLRVGEEIAGARALMDLASQLLQKAHTEIDEVSGRTSHSLRCGLSGQRRSGVRMPRRAMPWWSVRAVRSQRKRRFSATSCAGSGLMTGHWS